MAVERLEATYKKCGLVDQVWVYGNSFKNNLVAVVVPNSITLQVGGGGWRVSIHSDLG